MYLHCGSPNPKNTLAVSVVVAMLLFGLHALEAGKFAKSNLLFKGYCQYLWHEHINVQVPIPLFMLSRDDVRKPFGPISLLAHQNMVLKAAKAGGPKKKKLTFSGLNIEFAIFYM